MITIEHVTKVYPPKSYALNDVSFDIEAGEFVSIVGQSGSGKTTLGKLIIAEERPSSGKILIGDWDITKIKHRDIPTLRRQIGVVFQDYKLLPNKTVYENVAFAMEVSGLPRAKIKTIVPQVLKIVNIIDKSDRFPQQLSGGEQQRVAIARALVHRPKILLADEPTGNLDTVNTEDIINLLLKINEFGTTVILITHDPAIVNNVKKRVITLDQGELARDVKVGKYKLPI